MPCLAGDFLVLYSPQKSLFLLRPRAKLIIGIGYVEPGATESHGSDGSAQAPHDLTRNMLIEVWTKQGWPPTDSPTPTGFKVTPEGAYRIVAKSKKLSLKHRWMICFRDDSRYYIADVFGKLPPRKQWPNTALR